MWAITPPPPPSRHEALLEALAAGGYAVDAPRLRVDGAYRLAASSAAELLRRFGRANVARALAAPRPHHDDGSDGNDDDDEKDAPPDEESGTAGPSSGKRPSNVSQGSSGLSSLTSVSGLSVGDRVQWGGADRDIPRGAIGAVLALRQGRATVAFPRGNFSLQVDTIVREPRGFETSGLLDLRGLDTARRLEALAAAPASLYLADPSSSLAYLGAPPFDQVPLLRFPFGSLSGLARVVWVSPEPVPPGAPFRAACAVDSPPYRTRRKCCGCCRWKSGRL